MSTEYDEAYRITTAKHELCHALVSYAFRCRQIEVSVFKKPRMLKSLIGKARAAGACTQCYPDIPAIDIFILAAPSSSPCYRVEEADRWEFNYAVETFRRATSIHSTAAFRSFVLDPLRDYLESSNVVAIMEHLAVPLARVGKMRSKNHKDMERFFPRSVSMSMMEVMCRGLREAASSYPFVK